MLPVTPIHGEVYISSTRQTRILQLTGQLILSAPDQSRHPRAQPSLEMEVKRSSSCTGEYHIARNTSHREGAIFPLYTSA